MIKKLLYLVSGLVLCATSMKAQCTLGAYPVSFSATYFTNTNFLGNRYTLTDSATIVALGYKGAYTGSDVQIAIYAAAGNAIGNLIASTPTAAIAVGNQTLSIGAPVKLPPGDYWIMHNISTTAGAVTSNNCSCIPVAQLAATFGTVPANGSSASVIAGNNWQYGLWAVLQTPTVSIAPSSTVICSGNSATLTASGAKTYTWSNTSTGNSIVVSPTTGTNYTVTGSAGYCSASTTFSLAVIASPTVTVISSPTGSICAGQTLTLTATGGDTYSWSTGSTNTSIAVTPSATATYSVVGTSTTTGCSSSGSQQAIVAPAPSIGVSASSGPYCSGNNYTLTASGANSYTWSSGEVASTITVTPSGNYPYSVTGTGSNGCNGVLSQTFAISPTPTISVVSTASVVCPGNSATLTATGASFYGWSTGASGTATIVVTPTMGAMYSATGSDPSGCYASASTIINIGSVPNPTVVTNNANLCSGSTATLTASGGNTYTWSTGSGTNMVAISPTVTTTYTLMAASNAGCTNTTTFSQNVIASPTVSVLASNISICAGQTSTLTASGATTYTWNSGSTTNPLAVSPIVPTTYTVTGTGSNGCMNTATVTQNVNALPTVSASSSTVSLCIGSTATLTAGGANTYTWSTGSNTNPLMVSPTVNTTYTVTGANSNGCINSTTITQNVSNCNTTGISAYVNYNEFVVYPNPFTTKITVAVSEANVVIEITDAIGNVVYKANALSTKHEIDLSNYAQGIYFVKAGNSVKRIIKN